MSEYSKEDLSALEIAERDYIRQCVECDEDNQDDDLKLLDSLICS